MSLTTNMNFSCPYCMQDNDIEVDRDNDLNQEQIIDCQICCRPIEIIVAAGINDRLNIIACTDSE